MSAPFYTYGPITDAHRDGRPKLVRTEDGQTHTAIFRDGRWFYATDPAFPCNPLATEPTEAAL